ncbi:cation:proton antiporter [Patescibacteria group bacterium]|nr:cation:proton antiporter [Patescibacteria group bacterium]
MEELVLQFSIVIIVTAILSIVLEITKQPILIAFIFSGILIGPQGLGLITNSLFFEAIGEIGIVLLLYLIGLELKAKLFSGTFGKGVVIASLASLVIFGFGMGIGFATDLALTESFYLAMALVFSSTVVVMKLLNEEEDSNPYVRNYLIAALVTQDVIAIILLLFISSSMSGGALGAFEGIRFLAEGISLFFLAYILQRYLLKNVAKKIFHKPDIMFLMGLAWCFIFAELAEYLEFSREIGAFIAGISLTFLPDYKLKIITEKSETIRDFFMILFFFVLGAHLEFEHLSEFSALIIIGVLFAVILKPIIFNLLFKIFKAVPNESFEISTRLGQLSEFSIVVVLLGASSGHISMDFAMAIQVIMFISIVISTYFVQYIPFGKISAASKTAKK